jgi:PEP-CTERM motif
MSPVLKSTMLAVCASSAFAFAAPAQATIVTVFNDRDTGAASFDSTVTTAGGTVHTQSLSDGQATYTDFTLSKTPNATYTYFPESTTGSTVDISPAGSGSDPLNYRSSGINIDFGSTLLNSIGFEVGDWGTCCQPSALFISFDNGAAIQVGISNTFGDVFLTNGTPIVFLGAFDDSGTFSSVQFWGNGVGEFLVAGGTLHYALLDQGSLPGGGSVPEPSTWAMMLLGFGAAGFAVRRARKNQALLQAA